MKSLRSSGLWESAGALTLLLAAACSPSENPNHGVTNPVIGGSPSFVPPAAIAGTTGAPVVGPVTPGPSVVTPPAAGTAAPAPAAAGSCPTMQLSKCKACHDGQGTAGSPMGLVTYEDYLAPSKSNPSMPVYKLVQTRMHDMKKPMPPTGMLPAADLAVLDSWVAGGAKNCGFPTKMAAGAAGAGAPPTGRPGA